MLVKLFSKLNALDQRHVCYLIFIRNSSRSLFQLLRLVWTELIRLERLLISFNKNFALSSEFILYQNRKVNPFSIMAWQETNLIFLHLRKHGLWIFNFKDLLIGPVLIEKSNSTQILKLGHFWKAHRLACWKMSKSKIRPRYGQKRMLFKNS